MITFPNGWMSRDYQDPFFHAMGSGIKRAFLGWPRRHGKDVVVWNWCISEATRKTGTYYYFFPTYAEGKRILWLGKDNDGKKYLDYIPFIDDCTLNETDMRITFPVIEGGSKESVIQIIGTDSFDRIRGTNPVGCVFSEYAFQHPGAWKVVRPILTVNDGWAVFVSTFNGPNHAAKLHDYAMQSDEWYGSLLTIDDTKKADGSPVVTQAEIEEMRAEGVDEDTIQREWYCSKLAASEGAFYSRSMRLLDKEERIGDFPFDPNYKVYTYSDIGRDQTVILFVQYIGETVRIIDVLSESERELPYFAAELRGRRQELGYQYGMYHWPHDMENTEWGSSQTRLAEAGRLGLNPSKIVPKTGLYEGIDAVRRRLRNVYINKPKCEGLVGALWLYHKKWDEENKIYLKEPVHDWSSHYCDAMRNWAMSPRPLNPRLSLFGDEPAGTAIYNKDPFAYASASYGAY